MKAMKGCVGGKSGKKIKKKKKSKGDKGKVDSPPAMKAMKKSVPAKDEKKTHKKKDGKKTHKKKDKKTKGGKGTAPEWGDLLLWPAGGPVSNGAFTSAPLSSNCTITSVRPSKLARIKAVLPS